MWVGVKVGVSTSYVAVWVGVEVGVSTPFVAVCMCLLQSFVERVVCMWQCACAHMRGVRVYVGSYCIWVQL